MLNECLNGLNIDPAGIYVDGTAGGAGHSAEIAKRLKTGRLIAIDKDPTAIEAVRRRLLPYSATVIAGDFKDIRSILDSLHIPAVNGVLLDVGVSSHQLDSAERGFSYSHDAPLDMRMTREGFSAKDLLNTYSADELTRVFRDYGEEKFARRIAANICEAREHEPLETTFSLVEMIRRSIPAAKRRTGGHPAKRVFQAIRIEVNGELSALETGVPAAFERLNHGGRLAVITFHSLEDRIVKRIFQGLCTGCTCPPDFPICVCGKKPKAKLVNRKPILAGGDEIRENSRSKSAKLRVIERI